MVHTDFAIGGAFLVRETDPAAVFIPEEFCPEDRLIGRAAETFLHTEVLPHVERIESGDHALMHRLMQRAGALGLLGADVPEIYGGLDLNNKTAALIAEKLNPQQSFALTHEAHTVIATLPLLYFGREDQKRRYLPKLATGEWVGAFALSEANSGSDALAAQTRATLTPDGTHYVLNGAKSWITNSAFAQLFTVFAQVDGDKFTGFLVERDFPGVSFGPEENKLGQRGTSTRRVILDNVSVPAENALPVGKGQYAAFCALNMGRFKLEAGAVGGLKYLLAVCVGYAQQRRAFGHALSEFGLAQHKFAEMAARTFALESMVYRLAGDLDTGFDPVIPDAPDASARYHRAAEEFAIECNIVKVIGSETYSQMADEAIQIHGGYGYTEKFPVARAWRDQRLLRIGEGANEIVRLAIINLLLRRDKAGRLPLLETARSLSSSVPPLPFLGEGPGVGASAHACKSLALLLLARASELLGGELLQTQELAAAVADVVCAAYALDSVALRCRKLAAAPNAETVLLLAQIAARDHTDEAVRAAHYALDALPELATESVKMLLSVLPRPIPNPMHLRRDLAARVLEAGGWPL